jgi:hypothetical protein
MYQDSPRQKYLKDITLLALILMGLAAVWYVVREVF